MGLRNSYFRALRPIWVQMYRGDKSVVIWGGRPFVQRRRCGGAVGIVGCCGVGVVDSNVFPIRVQRSKYTTTFALSPESHSTRQIDF